MLLKWKKGHWVVIMPTRSQDRKRFGKLAGKILKVDRLYNYQGLERVRLFDPSDSTYHIVPSHMVHEPNYSYDEVFVLEPKEDFGEVVRVPPGIIVEHRWTDPKGKVKGVERTLHGKKVLPKSSVRTKKALYREADKVTKSELLDALHDRPKVYARRRFSQLYDDVPETKNILYNALEGLGTYPGLYYNEDEISLDSLKQAMGKVRILIPIPSRTKADQMTKRRLANSYVDKVIGTHFPEVDRQSPVGRFIVEKISDEHDIPMAYLE